MVNYSWQKKLKGRKVNIQCDWMNELNLYGFLLSMIFSLGFLLAVATLALGYLLILVGLMIVVRILNEPRKEIPVIT